MLLAIAGATTYGWELLIVGIYGCLFPDHLTEAFSTLVFFKNLAGFLLRQVFSYTCVAPVMYIQTTVVIALLFPYVLLEVSRELLQLLASPKTC